MELLTVDEVAEILKLTPYTIRQFLKAGTLPGVKIGARQWRVRKDDLDAYVNGQVGQGKGGQP